MHACDAHKPAWVINKHFMWNFPHVPNLGQDLTLRSLTNGTRRPIVSNSSTSILISYELTVICQFMCFWHLSNFKVKWSNSFFLLGCLKAIWSRSQNTKHFDSVLRNVWDMANWNFVTSALWPRFLGQGHRHHFNIFVFPPSRTTTYSLKVLKRLKTKSLLD